MSGKLFEGGYGAILNEDIAILEECLFTALAESMADRPLKVLEIGMHDGGTARGIENYVLRSDAKLAYWGIDVDPGTTRPRYIPKDATVIIGDSVEVFNQVPDDLDLVWVDGCHCFNHVVLETLHYSLKVRQGGFMCFHDVNPKGQGQEHQYHGPVIPEFGLAIDMAHQAIGFPDGWSAWAREGWSLFKQGWPTEVANCGTRAFKKG